MYLINSWRSSLQLLKPANFKLFLLVTLKAIKPTYFLLVKYWAWLWLFLYGGIWHMLYEPFLNYVWSINMDYTPIAEYGAIAFEVILRYLFIFGVCLAARPSIVQKTCAYFRGYWKHFLAFLILLTIFGGAVIGIIRVSSKFFPYNSIFTKLTLLPLVCMIEIVMRGGFAVAGVLLVFAILFLLDCPPSNFCLLSATKGMLLMTWYNLPLCFIAVLLFTSSYYGLYELFNLFGLVKGCGIDAFTICTNLLQPIPIIVYTNLYIKWVHEQSRLYYWQPS